MKKNLIIKTVLFVFFVTLFLQAKANEPNDTVYVFTFKVSSSYFIEIKPINDTPSWTLEYKHQRYNKSLNCEIYSGSYADVYLGDDWVAYKDETGFYKFPIEGCVENESKVLNN